MQCNLFEPMNYAILGYLRCFIHQLPFILPQVSRRSGGCHSLSITEGESGLQLSIRTNVLCAIETLSLVIIMIECDRVSDVNGARQLRL